ncbi:unnamed protein product, partial [Didymodactylos carnosus]
QAENLLNTYCQSMPIHLKFDNEQIFDKSLINLSEDILDDAFDFNISVSTLGKY